MSGAVDLSHESRVIHSHFVSSHVSRIGVEVADIIVLDQQLVDKVNKFWDIEEINNSKKDGLENHSEESIHLMEKDILQSYHSPG